MEAVDEEVLPLPLPRPPPRSCTARRAETNFSFLVRRHYLLSPIIRPTRRNRRTEPPPTPREQQRGGAAEEATDGCDTEEAKPTRTLHQRPLIIVTEPNINIIMYRANVPLLLVLSVSSPGKLETVQTITYLRHPGLEDINLIFSLLGADHWPSRSA